MLEGGPGRERHLAERKRCRDERRQVGADGTTAHEGPVERRDPISRCNEIAAEGVVMAQRLRHHVERAQQSISLIPQPGDAGCDVRRIDAPDQRVVEVFRQRGHGGGGLGQPLPEPVTAQPRMLRDRRDPGAARVDAVVAAMTAITAEEKAELVKKFGRSARACAGQVCAVEASKALRGARVGLEGPSSLMSAEVLEPETAGACVVAGEPEAPWRCESTRQVAKDARAVREHLAIGMTPCMGRPLAGGGNHLDDRRPRHALATRVRKTE